MRVQGLVGIAPSGKVTPTLIEVVTAHVQGILDLPVDILPEFEPPADSYNEARNQYHAGKLLDHLNASVDATYQKVLGVASYDLYLPIFTHVYGEAQVSGRTAVFSICRLEDSRVPKALSASGRETFLIRAAKVGLHELLHTYGMTHCRHTDCLMGFVTRLETLDAMPLYLCHSCRQFWEGIKP